MTIKLRRFSEEPLDIETNQIAFWDKNLDEGLYHGEYNDFQFNFEVGGKKYFMRFASSCYGDDEFDAVVYYSDGIATLFSKDDFNDPKKSEGWHDKEFMN